MYRSSYCPPLSQTFFPKMLVMLNNVSGDVTLLALSVIVVMDAPSTLSATDKLPLYDDWISFARSSISCLLWLTLTSDEHTNKMKYNQDIKLSKEPCILPKKFSFSEQHQEGIMLTSYQLPTSTFETSDWTKSVLNDARRIDHQKKVSATKSGKKSVIQVPYLLFINSPQRGNHVSGHDVNIQVFLSVPP